MLAMNVLAYAMPVTFAVMLVASVVLVYRTHRRHFLVQAVGFAIFVISQAVQYGAYKIYPLQFDAAGAMVANSVRDSLAWYTLWLSVVGLAVAAIGYVLQSAALAKGSST